MVLNTVRLAAALCAVAASVSADRMVMRQVDPSTFDNIQGTFTTDPQYVARHRACAQYL